MKTNAKQLLELLCKRVALKKHNVVEIPIRHVCVVQYTFPATFHVSYSREERQSRFVTHDAGEPKD